MSPVRRGAGVVLRVLIASTLAWGRPLSVRAEEASPPAPAPAAADPMPDIPQDGASAPPAFEQPVAPPVAAPSPAVKKKKGKKAAAVEPVAVSSTPVAPAQVSVSSPAAAAEPVVVSSTPAIQEPVIVSSVPAATAATSSAAAVPAFSSAPIDGGGYPTSVFLKPMPEATAVEPGTGTVTLEKVSVEDTGNRLLVLLQTSRPVECFVFERRDPPSLYVQFVSTQVYASGDPAQVVGTDPLSEIRYGYTKFVDATTSNQSPDAKFPIDYIELKLTRPVFYQVQQEGWVLVLGLDRTTTKVEVPELDFRFKSGKYEGASKLPPNPRVEDFIDTAQANSRLLAVARDEVELSKFRVFEARRALYPSASARVTSTGGKEVNPFPSEQFEGFEATSFRRKEYGLQFSQPIWQSGKLFNAFRQARLNKLMAFENVRKQAQDLTYEVKKAYYTLLKNQAILRIRRELVAQGEVLKDMVKKKHKLQLTSKNEVLNIEAQADQATYQLTGDEQDVALARLVITSLLNQSEPVPDPVPGALSFARMSFNVESIISWAQEHRPDVRIAVLNAELARFGMKSAQADTNIKVDASGFVGRAGAAFADDEFNMRGAWNVGLKASKPFYGNTLRGSYSKENTAPDLGQTFVTETNQRSVEVGIMDGFPGMSASRQAELQYERAKAELVEASRKAEYEVRETYYNLEKAARQLEAVREDMKYRQKDLEITREKAKLGLSELSQVMTAEVSYAQAQITEQEALSAYNVALSAMDRVAGAEVVKD